MSTLITTKAYLLLSLFVRFTILIHVVSNILNLFNSTDDFHKFVFSRIFLKIVENGPSGFTRMIQ